MGARAESVWVWDLQRREPVRKLAVENATDCALSADGRVLVTASGSPLVRTAGARGLVQIWDL
jgi:WD40 repeat protein